MIEGRRLEASTEPSCLLPTVTHTVTYASKPRRSQVVCHSSDGGGDLDDGEVHAANLDHLQEPDSASQQRRQEQSVSGEGWAAGGLQR
jgi:hypothetical protein